MKFVVKLLELFELFVEFEIMKVELFELMVKFPVEFVVKFVEFVVEFEVELPVEFINCDDKYNEILSIIGPYPKLGNILLNDEL